MEVKKEFDDQFMDQPDVDLNSSFISIRLEAMSGICIQISRFFRVPCQATSDQSESANVKAHLHYVDCQPEEGLLR